MELFSAVACASLFIIFQLRWYSELVQAVCVLYLIHRHVFSSILKTASAIAAIISSQLSGQISSCVKPRVSSSASEAGSVPAGAWHMSLMTWLPSPPGQNSDFKFSEVLYTHHINYTFKNSNIHLLEDTECMEYLPKTISQKPHFRHFYCLN